MGVIQFPDAPMVPEPLRGRYTAHDPGGVHSATRRKVSGCVAPLRAIGPTPEGLAARRCRTPRATPIHSDPDFPHAYYGGQPAMLRDLEAVSAQERCWR